MRAYSLVCLPILFSLQTGQDVAPSGAAQSGDPLVSILETVDRAMRGNSPQRLKAKLRSIRTSVTGLQSHARSFDEELLSNLTALARRFSDLEMTAPSERDLEVLSDLKDDFEDKLMYFDGGFAVEAITALPFKRTAVYSLTYSKKVDSVIAASSEGLFGPDGAISEFKLKADSIIEFYGDVAYAQQDDKLFGFNLSTEQKYEYPLSDKLSGFSAGSGFACGYKPETGKILVWSRPGEQPSFKTTWTGATAHSLALACGEGRFAAASPQGELEIYDIQSGDVQAKKTGLGNVSDVLYVGTRSLVAVGQDGRISLILDGESEPWTESNPGIAWTDVSADSAGRWVATAGRRRIGSTGMVKLLELETKQSYSLSLPSDAGAVTFSSDGERLYTGESDGTLRKVSLSRLKEGPPEGGLRVQVETYQAKVKKPGFDVWYVPKALLDVPSEYLTFEDDSHCHEDLPPGRYWVWAGDRSPNVDCRKPLRLNSSAPDLLPIDVPENVPARAR